MYYTECKPKNENRGGLGTSEAKIVHVFNRTQKSNLKTGQRKLVGSSAMTYTEADLCLIPE